jgi:RNA polymerase sigma-B factor
VRISNTRGLFAVLPDEREALLVRHRPLAMFLSRRFAGRGESLEDLQQVAMLALLKAIDRLDPARNETFSSFASVTVVGELKRHFRDQAWTVRVPRKVQDLALRVTSAVGTLTQELSHPPTVREIAERVGAAEGDVLDALSASRAYRVDSLDAPKGADDYLAPIDTLAAGDEQFDCLESWQSVVPLIRALPERERTILYLRFFEEWSQNEIAQELGISQMHVSRLLAQSLSLLRERAAA